MARVDGLTSAAVPVEILALDGTGAPVTQVGTFSVGLYFGVTRASDGYAWDFSSSTFKATPAAALDALAEYSASRVPGLFHYPGGWTPPSDDTYSITISQVPGSPVVANVPAFFDLFIGPEVGQAQPQRVLTYTLGQSDPLIAWYERIATFTGEDLPAGVSSGSIPVIDVTAGAAANLVDDLVPMVDELRNELHADMGIRQFRLYHVHAQWSGGLVGVGAKTITTISEILPAPRLVMADTHHLTEGGLQEIGVGTLSEVSLSYSEAQLLGKPMAPGAEFFYLTVDGLGQGVQRRVFIPQDHPWPDREKTIGWKFRVRRVDGPPNVAVVA
jgi:hypothetical protein